MNLDYAQVLDGCKHGDAKSQEALYKEFSPLMLGIGMRYLHSRDDAQDLLHDAFIKVLTNIKQVNDPAQLKAWMYRVMFNTVMDHFRNDRHLMVYGEDDNLEQLSGVSENATGDEAGMDLDVYEMPAVMEAIDSLPASFRAVFNMRAVEEMEFADIARTLNITEQTARAHLSKARSLLRRYIEEKTKKRIIS